jgi:hypothetical protein
MNTNGSNTERILEIFRRIEERDPNRPNPPRVFELFQSDFESYWPPSLPYGSERGVNKRSVSWEQVWNPLQPTVTERRMDPRVIAGNGDEIDAGSATMESDMRARFWVCTTFAKGSWRGRRCSTSTSIAWHHS